MAIDNFIPEVWSSRFSVYNEKALTYGMLVGRNYQSDVVSYGDTIKINDFNDISIEDYTRNGAISAPETLTGLQVVLDVDQAKSFNFEVDDIDKTQQNPKVMDRAMRRAGYNMADEKDQFIASLYTGVAATNVIGSDGTPTVPTASTVYGLFTQAGQKLDEANIPSMERWVVIPPWMKKMLLDSGEFTADSALGDEVKVNGQLGKVAGFNVFVSNNVPNDTDTKYKVIFGYPEAIEFVDQIENMEAYRPEASHSDAVKGLGVYGGVLVEDTGIVVLTANKA